MQQRMQLPRTFLREFSRFQPARLGEISMELMPMPSEIPVLSTEYYDPAQDCLAIRFQTTDEPQEQRGEDDVYLLLERKTDRIAGIKVLGLQRAERSDLNRRIESTLHNHLQVLTTAMHRAPSMEQQLGQLGRLDIEERKSRFLIAESARILRQFDLLQRSFGLSIKVLSATH